MPAHTNPQQFQHVSGVLPALIVLIGGVVGGSVGLLVGMQGDHFLNIDSAMVGVVLGAVLGSVLTPWHGQMKVARLGSAALGILIPILSFIGIQRVSLEILIGMTMGAILGTAILVTVFNQFSKTYK
jgi:hypothetical protein